jgi:predicted kinase
MSPEELAQKFHETYERLAPSYGYETRKDSAVPWDKVPERNKNLMIAVCTEILQHWRLAPRTVEDALEVCRKWRLTDEELENLLK